MTDNAEGGIATSQAQAAQSKGLAAHHKSTIKTMDDRISVYLAALAVIALGVIWVAFPSPLIRYGSLVVGVFTVLFIAFMRVRNIKKLREARQQQAEQWEQKAD